MVTVLCTAAPVSFGAFEFKVRFVPQAFVLSSGADMLGIHTNVPFYVVDFVQLDIGDSTNVLNRTSCDSSQNLVARCGRETVKVAAGYFDSLFTEIPVKLTIDSDGVIDTVSRMLRVGR
jgi:hypothetical protein